MKLLFYINTLGHGGAERVMVNLANRFSLFGHDCVLVTSFSAEWEYPSAENVLRINLSSKKTNGFIKRNFKLTKEIREIIKKEKPDSVISFMAEPNFRMLLATVGLKCRKIVSVRNDPDKEYPNALFKLLAKTLYKLADGVVFQTVDAQKWFPKYIQKKSRIIMNQVDDVFFNTQLQENRKNIVTIGRLTAQKNHKMLIKAFYEISSQIEDNLIIYGEGELREELEALVKELGLENRVFLPGTTKTVPDVLSKAKLFVLSSDYEGMPNALLEAMAMGVPCISTDCPCGGPREIFAGLSENHLVDVGDTVKMSKAIKLFCDMNGEMFDSVSVQTRKIAQSFKSENVEKEWKLFIEVK